MSVEIPRQGERRPDQFTLEQVVSLAKETALSFGGHHPTIIAQGSLGAGVGQVDELAQTHEDKVQQMVFWGFSLGRSGKVGELQEVFFISEAWLSVSQEGQPPGMQPSKDPHRKEILIIDHLKIEEQRARLVLLEMVRDSDGRLTELRDFEEPGEDEQGLVESPLLDAFVEGFRLGVRRPN